MRVRVLRLISIQIMKVFVRMRQYALSQSDTKLKCKFRSQKGEKLQDLSPTSWQGNITELSNKSILLDVLVIFASLAC